MRKKIFNYFYRHTFLCHILYKHAIACRTLFPNEQFIDLDTPYQDEIQLIWRAIRYPSYQLEEVNMGIVLSQLIQSDVSYADAQEICAQINDKYADEGYYITRRNIIELQLEELRAKIKD
jgi:hypothetical protein